MNKRGFTLLEVSITITIFSIIMVALLSFIASSYQSYFALSDRTSTLSMGRTALERMIKEIRKAKQSDLGAFPVASATTNEIIFYANVDSDALTERVRYTLQGNNLLRGVTKPTGMPLQYLAANESVQTLASEVYNGGTALFAFYNGQYTGTEAPMAFPVTLTSIRHIQFTVFIDETPGTPPAAVQMTSAATIRNLKDNL